MEEFEAEDDGAKKEAKKNYCKWPRSKARQEKSTCRDMRYIEGCFIVKTSLTKKKTLTNQPTPPFKNIPQVRWHEWISIQYIHTHTHTHRKRTERRILFLPFSLFCSFSISFVFSSSFYRVSPASNNTGSDATGHQSRWHLENATTSANLRLEISLFRSLFHDKQYFCTSSFRKVRIPRTHMCFLFKVKSNLIGKKIEKWNIARIMNGIPAEQKWFDDLSLLNRDFPFTLSGFFSGRVETNEWPIVRAGK